MNEDLAPRRGRPPNAMREAQRAPQRIKIRDATNRFDVDKSRIPAGMSYQWCACKVMGQEMTEQMIAFEENGWTPVPADRHPELAGRNAKPGQQIEKGGQILMERPIELTNESEMIDATKAREQVRHQAQKVALQSRQSGAGKFTKIERHMEITPDE